MLRQQAWVSRCLELEYPARSAGQPRLLMDRPLSGPGMGSRVKTIDEPGVLSYRRGNSEREILRELEGTGQLTIGGSGLESRGDRDQEFRPLEVVGHREALSRESATTDRAEEAGNGRTTPGSKGPVHAEAETGSPARVF